MDGKEGWEIRLHRNGKSKKVLLERNMLVKYALNECALNELDLT